MSTKNTYLFRETALVLSTFIIVLFYGCQPSATEEGAAASIPDEDWAFYGNDVTNQRFSTVTQLTPENVGGLDLVWKFDLGVDEAQECTPIVVDGTMYVTTASGPKYVYALDAKTGELKWQKEFDIPSDVARFACCGIVNRGATYSDGKIFVGRLDGNLTALDAQTGDELWTTQVVDYKQGSVITSPPLVVGNKVMSGFGGGEYGATGYLSAYDVNTGEQVWRTYTVPGDAMPTVRATWKGDSWRTGGAVPWFIGSYDPELNLVYWGTSNPSPWNAAMRGPDTHEYGEMTNLYSASMLAINPDDGQIQWHYQTTPYDAWDYDGVNEPILGEVNVNGEETPVMMKADRNGFFYVINRTNGKLVSAEKFVRTDWAERIDLESGRPVEDPAYRLTSTNSVDAVWPSFIGGKNWQPMAYSPKTKLAYIPANHLGMSFAASEVEYQRGYFFLGSEWEIFQDGEPGELIAWDVENGKKAWGKKLKYPIPGGPVVTDGNLVFFGELTGNFHALNATTGEELWSYKTDSGIGAGAMTYASGGKQYVSVVDGRPTVIPGFIGGELAEEMTTATPAGGTLYVFALPDAQE
jgi:PQQ-dependent dehydrogenase (methanol/ethanol family)